MADEEIFIRSFSSNISHLGFATGYLRATVVDRYEQQFFSLGIGSKLRPRYSSCKSLTSMRLTMPEMFVRVLRRSSGFAM